MELVFDQGNDDGLVVVVLEGLKEKKIESLLEDPVVGGAWWYFSCGQFRFKPHVNDSK